MDMYSNRESPPVYKHVIRKVVLFAGDLQKDSGGVMDELPESLLNFL